MIEVSVEVGSDSARFRVVVRAESIRQALAIAGDNYYPAGEVRLVHPIDPEAFFVEDLAAAPGPIESERRRSWRGKWRVIGPDVYRHGRTVEMDRLT